jgi:hypothetical protein
LFTGCEIPVHGEISLAFGLVEYFRERSPSSIYFDKADLTEKNKDTCIDENKHENKHHNGSYFFASGVQLHAFDLPDT